MKGVVSWDSSVFGGSRQRPRSPARFGTGGKNCGILHRKLARDQFRTDHPVLVLQCFAAAVHVDLQS